MKIEIFAERFRGFKSIDLDLDQTSFVVGDNSSGKSSLISLIAYVLRTELEGIPELDEKIGSDPYDFFSPYFDYSDVTIGFVAHDDEHPFGRAITFSKGKNYNHPVVNRTTYLCKSGSISLRRSRNIIQSAINTKSQRVALKNLQRRHSEVEGFAKTPLKIRGTLNKFINYIKAIDEKPKIEGADILLGELFDGGVAFPFTRHIGPVRGKPERYYDFSRRYKSVAPTLLQCGSI